MINYPPYIYIPLFWSKKFIKPLATFCHHLFTVYLQALEVAQKHYGEDSKELIPIYQCLARAESSQGDASSHERATKLFLQAHDISKLR